MRVFIYLCIDWLRRRAGMQERRLMQLSGRNDTPAFADTAGQTAACEQMDRMMNIIWQLPDAQQTVLRMRHIEGMEMAEKVESHADAEATIQAAEQDMLNNISDPEERKRIGRLLE